MHSLTPILAALLSVAVAFTPTFKDVTIQAGIDITPDGKPRKLKKYGSPTIADLDGDGWYDFIFVHHGPESPEIYFNKRDGTFSKSSWRSRRDNHAITAFRLPGTRDRFFTLVPGGNKGFRPNPPAMYQVLKNRKVLRVDDKFGVNVFTARGRSVVFLPLRKNGKKTDVVYLNDRADPKRCPGCTDGQYDPYAFTGGSPLYRPRKLKGFNPNPVNSRGLAIDSDGDRNMELLTYPKLTLHKVVGNFKVEDVSKQVLGPNAYADGVDAVAEIDFDNDGDLDLYVARESKPDLLLENRGGKYVNVAGKAGIPKNTMSHGVTVGDFNNDRLMDIYVTVLKGGPDVLLLNNGDGTFRKVDIGIGKQGANGDNAMAVDYDYDGRVDLVRSEGDWGDRSKGGQFRILRNVPKKGIGRWIKVRVGSIGQQTSLYAVVVVTGGGKKMVRRVGPMGVSISASYYDTLHFGIGKVGNVKVTVTWLNGVVLSKRVFAGTIGRFGNY